jgi:prepilin-type N-terminal cleavage/methylation domain-containing protein
MTGGGVRGFTVIELLVALVVFAALAGALAQTLVRAQRVRASSALWLRATALAEERLERLRAGDRSEDAAPIGPFTRAWRAEPAAAAPGLERRDVEVTWEDHGPRRFVLSALARTAP